jgi:hypothetical protein
VGVVPFFHSAICIAFFYPFLHNNPLYFRSSFILRFLSLY